MEGHDHTAHSHGVAHGAGELDPHSIHSLLCDGSIEPGHKGSWKGHVFPGAVFILWGSWWAWSTLILYLGQAAARRPYCGRPWYPFPLRLLRYLEPALKVAVPLAAVFMELWADHHWQYQYLYCPEGTKYAGRFALANLNNWQHALSYPGFVLSGLVDLAAAAVPLPPGTSQAVLGSAFASSAFIMFTHEKHEPQDKMVHWLLAVSMLLSTLGVVWEMGAAARRNVLAGAGKALALVLQGAWLCQIAAVEFEGRPQWSTNYPGGAMFASTVFASIATLCVACTLAFYLLLALLNRHGLLPLPLLLPELGEELELAPRVAWEEHGLVEAGIDAEEQVLHFHKPLRQHLDHFDSAHHSDDNSPDDRQGLLGPGGGSGKGRARGSGAGGAGTMAALHIAHARSDTADADAYV